MVLNLLKIMIFKIAVLFIGLGSSMTSTYDLTVLTKTKEMTRYCGSNVFDGKIVLNTSFYGSSESQCTYR
jgi:hypothetical protein